MKKGLIFACILMIITSMLFINGCSNIKSHLGNKNDVIVTISDKLIKTDLENQDVYKYYYDRSSIKDEYEYYSCIVKVENNTDSMCLEMEFDKNKKNDDNFLTEFKLMTLYNFSIESHSTGYLTAIISVKKGISEEELNEIPYKLPSKIILKFAEDHEAMDYDFKIKTVYSITSEDYSNKEVQIHTFPF